MSPAACAECGAALAPGQECDELFHTLLAWEQSDPARKGSDHHLLVLCWEIQHPSRFTPEAVSWARGAVRHVIRDGIPAHQLRRENRATGPGRSDRAYKITRTDGVVVARAWSRTLSDVVAEGADAMPGSVRRWAEAVLRDLDADGS